MTVAELIEELRQMPQHHPILCDTGLRYAESIKDLSPQNSYDHKLGPHVIIRVDGDPRNHKHEWE